MKIYLKGDEKTMELTKQAYFDLYFSLLLTRRLEEKLRSVFKSQKPDAKIIVGNVYLSTLQEAISVGAAFAIRPTDWLSHTHRDNGALLVHGRVSPEEIFANYLGRATGPSRGRDSAANFGLLDRRNLLKHPYMGMQLLVNIGVAWELMNQKRDDVVLGFFGDGATSEGFVHEVMNGAGIWNLPMVFVCNNNQWAISTPFEKQVAGGSIAKRAEAYGFPGVTVDGTDILAVYDAVAEAAGRARSGEGPTLVECKTFRLSGHAEHDPADYIPKELFDEWKKPEHDPLVKFEKFLRTNGIMTDDDFAWQNEGAQEEVEDAWRKAISAPLPDPDSCLTDVFAEGMR